VRSLSADDEDAEEEGNDVFVCDVIDVYCYKFV
jgi:hypothetical protein